MHEKKSIFVYFIIFCILYFSTLCTGCVSNKHGQADPTILEYQRRIDELEARNKEHERIRNSTADRLSDLSKRSSERFEDIKRRADAMDDSISRIMFLFGEYESEVDRIIGEINNIRAEEQTKE